MHKQISITGSVLFAGLLTVISIQGIRASSQAVRTSPLPPFHLVDQQGGATNAVAADDHYAYISIGPRLAKVDITVNPPKLVWQSPPLPGFIKDITLDDDYVYYSVAGRGVYRTGTGRYCGYRMIGISDPQRLHIALGHLWAAAGADGFSAYRLDPNWPSIEGHYEPGGYVHDISVNRYTENILGEKTWYGFLASGAEGITFFDIHKVGSSIYGLTTCAPRPTGDPATSVTWDPVEPTMATYVGTSSGLEVYSGDGGCYPQLIGQYTGLNSYDVKVFGAHAYVISDGSDVFEGTSSLHKVNVAGPEPYKVASLDFPGEATAVDYSGGRVYVAGGGNGQANSGGGLRVFDSTPLAALSTYETSGAPQDMAFSGSGLVSVHGSLGLSIWDISSPTSPVLTGTYDTDGDALRVTTSGGLAFVSDDGPGLQIISITHPAMPTTIGSYDPGRLYRSIAVSGTLAILSSDEGGSTPDVWRVIDVSDPSEPLPLGQLDLRTENIVMFEQYAVGVSGDVYVVDLSDPLVPVLTATWTTPGYAFDVALDGGLAYVADGNALRIYDSSSITNPVEIGSLNTPGFIARLSLYHHYVFLALGSTGVMAIDVSDPANPTEIASIDTFGVAKEVLVRDHIAYVADGSGGMLTFELAPWLAPAVTQVITAAGGALVSPDDGTSYAFPSDTFPNPVILTHTPLTVPVFPLPDGMADIGHSYEITSEPVPPGTNLPPTLTRCYSVSIQYSDWHLGNVQEDSLGLYHWTGSAWELEPSSQVFTAVNTLTANPNHLSIWAVLGERAKAVYLPLTVRNL
jgi:hypothetical protein